ncbi:hypothetical protein F4678DRAFT_340582 [Xylaria arbuscula]|nr:hypothetical protein F4678DRAFT_340582 [Xylaria arbuscula]
MKFFASIIIAHLSLAWALPQFQAVPAEIEDLFYAPCNTTDIFDAAYCCDRGVLGNVTECQLAILPLSEQNFEDQCTLFQKTSVCCIPPSLINVPPTLCVPSNLLD